MKKIDLEQENRFLRDTIDALENQIKNLTGVSNIQNEEARKYNLKIVLENDRLKRNCSTLNNQLTILHEHLSMIYHQYGITVEWRLVNHEAFGKAREVKLAE